jgi:hypothetical protein
VGLLADGLLDAFAVFSVPVEGDDSLFVSLLPEDEEGDGPDPFFLA